MVDRVKLNKVTLALIAGCTFFFLVLILYETRGDVPYIRETVKISQLLSSSIFLAEAAGKKVAAIRKDPNLGTLTKGETKEGVPEYVTAGDQQSHELITSGLRLHWPNIRLRSEEKDRPDASGNVVQTPLFHDEVMLRAERDETVPLSEVDVWIDPLDATKEYTEGGEQPELLKYVMVMICITVSGQPIAGVLHQPFARESEKGPEGISYWAWVRHGVSHTVTESTQTDGVNEGEVRLIVSRSHPGDVVAIAKGAMKDKDVVEIKAAGAGYKTLQVVQNKADLYFHTTLIKKWDLCAANALLNAVGGVMTTRRGEMIDYSLSSDAEVKDGIVAVRSKETHQDYMNSLQV